MKKTPTKKVSQKKPVTKKRVTKKKPVKKIVKKKTTKKKIIKKNPTKQKKVVQKVEELKEEVEELEEENDNKKLIIGVLALVIIIVGGVFFLMPQETPVKTAPITPQQPVIGQAHLLTILYDSSCALCDTNDMEKILSEQFFNNKLEFKKIDYKTKEAQELINKLGLDFVPAYVFTSDVENTPKFSDLEGALIQKDDLYYVNPFATDRVDLFRTILGDYPTIIEGEPSKGTGSIEIIEYSDYNCPFCKRAEQTVSSVLKKYFDSVNFVHRDFPIEKLSGHNYSQEAAEATFCAKDQGKYWELHDKFYTVPQGTFLTNEDITSFAEEIGLNMDLFTNCMSEDKYAQQVVDSIAEGREYGVSGTPTFFINGVRFSAVSDQIFESLIQEAIAS